MHTSASLYYPKQEPPTCVKELSSAPAIALTYAAYAQHHPDEVQIVGVADPIPERRKLVADLYDLPNERCFASAEECRTAQVCRFRDQRHDGSPTCGDGAATAGCRGYDMLLEKPFAVSEADVATVRAAEEYGRDRRHLSRAALRPLYTAIRQKVIDGAIGEILNVQAVEHVSYHHMAVGFVRGKWNSKRKCFSPMLMAKCCHDLDLIAWMKKRGGTGVGGQLWQQHAIPSRERPCRRRAALPRRLRN
ncbi:MAG: Gfo/Idh/MocA family oxidoreductase [Caldilineaceae bacterium]